MKKELSWDYDILAKKMIDFTKSQEKGDFKIKVAEFQSDRGLVIKRNILSCEGQQIFQMNDGKFILEIVDGGDLEYYYSEDINDLI